MWLSKMLSKSDKTMTAESGSVTLSDKNTCEIAVNGTEGQVSVDFENNI